MGYRIIKGHKEIDIESIKQKAISEFPELVEKIKYNMPEWFSSKKWQFFVNWILIVNPGNYALIEFEDMFVSSEYQIINTYDSVSRELVEPYSGLSEHHYTKFWNLLEDNGELIFFDDGDLYVFHKNDNLEDFFDVMKNMHNTVWYYSPNTNEDDKRKHNKW